MKTNWMITFAALLIVSASYAKENAGIIGGKLCQSQKLAAGDCGPATASVDLDINNVRARIFTGGDMWWDLSAEPKYEIPKSSEDQPENPSSLFAGAIWIGGIDAQ